MHNFGPFGRKALQAPGESKQQRMILMALLDRRMDERTALLIK
jgi:hypothetical protein